MASAPDVIGGEGSVATAAQGGADGDTAAAVNQHRANEDDHDYNGEYDDEEGEEEEEEIVMDEEEMLQMLDQMEPPLSVCQRLFKEEEDEGVEEKGEKGDGGSWLVLSAKERSSLRQRGFVVLDALAPAGLAAEAYEEATARAAAGSLAPAHGGGTSSTSTATMSPSDDPRADRCCTDDEGQAGGQHASTAAPAPQLTGYVGSVRDDLTAFISAEREAAACAENGAGAVSRTLAILARLGEDLGRMVRLKGRVEHQLAVYPAGIGARYERHRDAYPDDGYDDDEEEEDENSSTTRAEGGEGKDGSGSGSVSFRRVTAICYLRGGGSPWQAQDGGALRLYPPTTSNIDRGVGGSDSRVVFKFASQLEVSGGSEPQEQPRELQQEPTVNSGDGGGGKDEDNEGSTPLPAASCGGSEDGSCAGDARAGAHEVGDEGDGRREDFVDVVPLAGRAVVFLSGAVEHEVLPVTGTLPRAALTTWFH